MSLGDNDSDLSLSIDGSVKTGTIPLSTIKVEVKIPELDYRKCFIVSLMETVGYIKKSILNLVSSQLRDPLNYGLYLPCSGNKAGKFLQEERPIREYGLDPDHQVVELRYKKRLFKSMSVNVSKLKKINSRNNLKTFLEYIELGDKGKVLKLLNKGVDPNFQSKDTGDTPLSKACALDGNLACDMIKILIEGGAHMDYRHLNGRTPLHVAAILGNFDAVKTLLDLGQSPNTCDLVGLTPLYHSVVNNSSATCTERLLFDYSVIGIEDENGLQEIHQACRFGRSHHLEYLLQYGADINSQTSRNGNTPLHICAYLNQESCARMLLFRGANKAITNRAGHTARQQALLSGHRVISSLIDGYDEMDIVPIKVHPMYNEKRKNSGMNVQTLHRSRSIGKVTELPGGSITDGSSVRSERRRKNSCRMPELNNQMVKPECTRSYSMSTRATNGLSSSVTDLNQNQHTIKSNEENHDSNWWPEWDQDANSDNNSEDEAYSGISKATSSVTGATVGPMQRRSARSKSKSSGDKRSSKARSHSCKRRNEKADNKSDINNIDVNYLPRMVVLQKTNQGFGFVIRGLKASSGVEFSPTKKQPALQYFEEVEPNSVASRAGLKKGDFILEVNNHSVVFSSHEDTVSLIKQSGDILALKVVTVPIEKISAMQLRKYSDYTIRSHNVDFNVDSSDVDSSICGSEQNNYFNRQLNTRATTGSNMKQQYSPQYHNTVTVPPPPSLFNKTSGNMIFTRQRSCTFNVRPESLASVDSIFPLPPPPNQNHHVISPATITEEPPSPPPLPLPLLPPMPPERKTDVANKPTVAMGTINRKLLPPPPPPQSLPTTMTSTSPTSNTYVPPQPMMSSASSKPPPPAPPPPSAVPPPPNAPIKINITKTNNNNANTTTNNTNNNNNVSRKNSIIPISDFDSHLRQAIAKRRQKIDNSDQVSLISSVGATSPTTVNDFSRSIGHSMMQKLNSLTNNQSTTDENEENEENNNFSKHITSKNHSTTTSIGSKLYHI